MSLRPATASVLGAIGQTPAVWLTRLTPLGAAGVLVKLENLNPTGSHKDRVALELVESAENRGLISPGMTLVDYTGGNTGASLAVVCALKRYGCQVVCSDAYSPEKIRSMRAFGAEVHIVQSRGGEVDGQLIPRMLAKVAELSAATGSVYLDQHRSEAPVVAQAGLARELIAQAGATIDTFCAGFGTGALLMGVAKALRDGGQPTQVVALEPDSSPVLSGGAPGRHRIEGLGYGFVPPLIDRSLLAGVRLVSEADARETARRLAREEGILAGLSSGFNVAGALALAGEIGPGKVVATVCCDTGFKYMSGDLFSDGPRRPGSGARVS